MTPRTTTYPAYGARRTGVRHVTHHGARPTTQHWGHPCQWQAAGRLRVHDCGMPSWLTWSP